MRKGNLFFIVAMLLNVSVAIAADIKNIGVPYVQNYTKAQYQSGKTLLDVVRGTLDP